ncbi:flagellar hook assembly protein FlgD [Cellulomonas wangsupingiae]|uniref:Flagellar hook capping protein n=1 Tax=Cellulomonas wangsupingiae TaxID=2968085 RepID=A0ABY5K7B9_9CELL|nr:flagellar hook capping FlgD N-terminal domain-containing protein [Cellulomonas wangsupingiae]MCC2334156.1 flagellar hook capping protein [Cellulomonas wangsupingiae]UUI65835.1 flagellar hook capping protein [Cellulomonas wangsupingiae]
MSIDTSYAQHGASRTTTDGTSTDAATDGGSLDKQAFLELLVTQLRYQDPTSPMDTSQLMAQTTQLTTMERLVELSDTQREAFALQMRSSAAALVGQEVRWEDEDGTSHTGVVTGVSYASAVPTVRVGDVDLRLDAIAAVTTPGASPSPSTPAPTTPPPAGTDTPAPATPAA